MFSLFSRRSPGVRAMLGAFLGLLVAHGVPADSAASQKDTRLVSGGTAWVDGRAVSAWARLDADDSPVEAGVTFDYGIVTSPPDALGSGPAGAIAVVEFPEAVQSSSILNHFAMHWEEHGHTPQPFEVPHFDMHFYGIPSSQVMGIGPADTATPAPSRMAAGYVYGGPDAFVPQMGGHALRPADLQQRFEAVLIMGYYQGNMIFVEPMVTRAFLQEKRGFDLSIPRPSEIGRSAWYPTRVEGTYDAAANTYRVTFGGFERAAR